MAEEQSEEQLVQQAKAEILKRIIKSARHTNIGDNGILEMAEAYTVLDRGLLSGRVNRPKS